MGVLRLFRHLLNAYHNKFYTTLDSSRSRPICVDMLLIDLNAIFHPCCREVFVTERKDLLGRKPVVLYEEKEAKAFEKVTQYIELIMKLTPPSKVLYLAIDGVAGMCKQSQQRKRRYKNAQNRLVDAFDTCHISAGTPWMARLGEYIVKWIQVQKLQRLAKVKVIYSDMYVAGEGEHKLIRYLGKYANLSTTYSVFSPDADLIMLCMCLSQGKGFILRENIYDDIQGTHILVDCDKLKRCITDTLLRMPPYSDHQHKRIRLEHENEHTSLSESRIIRDYVLFLMLVGNDFLPSLYCLEIGNDGIETLQDCYVTAANKCGHLVNEVNGINKAPFAEMFKELASCEVALIVKKFLKGGPNPDLLLHKHMKENNVLDFAELRKEYYTTKFKSLTWTEHTTEDGDVISEADAWKANVKQICMAYLRGLHFVMTYYIEGIPTFDWCYEFHYAPLMCDLSDTLISMSIYQWNDCQQWKYKPPLTLNQALLGVIPPSSFEVLPPSVQPLLKKNASHPLFKEDFEVDLQGKYQEYEGVCLLPNVSYDTLRKICKDKYLHHDPLIF